MYADKAISLIATRKDGTKVTGISPALATSEMVGKTKTEIIKTFDGKIGEIETALDNIIAIQNTLIGGSSV